MLQTALSAFIGSEAKALAENAIAMGQKRPQKKRKAAMNEEEEAASQLKKKKGGEVNEHMATLFERLPEPVAVAASPSAASALRPPATRVPKSAINAAIETHYYNADGTPRPANPELVAQGEKDLPPIASYTVEHYGTSCGPNEKLISVARYGRVYKRKASWISHRTIKQRTPPGMRYCRMCDGFLPLGAFYTHIPRLVCREHHAKRVIATEQLRYGKDHSMNVGYQMWISLNRVRATLGYTCADYDAQDMRALVIHCGIPFGMNPRVLPIDPSLPLRPRNVAIVSKTSFDLILRMYEHMCSRALYIAQVQRCNLIPRHLDVGWPEFPTHNPRYQRKDMEVGGMLDQEMAMAPGEEWQFEDRLALERMISKEPPTPWVIMPANARAVMIAMRARSDAAQRQRKPRKKGGEEAAPPE